jgi:hypothetical protein
VTVLEEYTACMKEQHSVVRFFLVGERTRCKEYL